MMAGTSDARAPSDVGADAGDDYAARLRACALARTCELSGGYEPGARIGSCVELLTEASASGPMGPNDAHEVACLLGATDCAGARRCLTRDVPPDACRPVDGGRVSPSVCVGDLRVECGVSGTPQRASDCAAVGLHCRDDGGGATGATCVDGVPCDPGETSACASPTTARRCVGGMRQTDDCARSLPGSSCALDSTGAPVCSRSGDGCGPDLVPAHCDGSRLAFRCLRGVLAGSIDCAAVSPAGRCVDNGDGRATCAAETNGCQTAGSIDSCDGDAIVTCYFGHTARFSCASLGYRTCELVPRGDRPFVQCRN
jgi:hypothetical protein